MWGWVLSVGLNLAILELNPEGGGHHITKCLVVRFNNKQLNVIETSYFFLLKESVNMIKLGIKRDPMG